MCEQKTTQADEWMKQVREINSRKKKSRMDIIGQNGNDGEHYGDGHRHQYVADPGNGYLFCYVCGQYEHPELVKDNNKDG